MIRIILSFLLLALLNCTQHIAIDLGVHFCGKISDKDNSSIDSAKIEVIDIKDVGHESIGDFIGRIYYSDDNGSFRLILPGGVEWDEHTFSGNKKYTKYIVSATIKVSKVSFKDTAVTFHNTNYEESKIDMDIVLEKKY
jgi:hypothetical protein